MKTIAEKYQWTQNELARLQAMGLSFLWNGIDLGDVLISELIAGIHPSDKPTKTDNIAVLMMTMKGLLKRIATKQFKRSNKEKVLLFVNEPNQLQVIEPVWAILKRHHIPIHIVTTKEKIFRQLPANCSSKSLAYGFRLTNLPFKSHKDHAVVKIIQNSMPKISYLYQYFSRLLHQSSFSYVLVGNDITAEGKLLASLAKKYHKHVGTIQHGSINRINPTYKHSLSDDFFVYGEKPANELIFLGKKRDTITISGWPLQQEYKWNLSRSKQKEDKRFCSDLLVCFSGPGHSVTEDLHQTMISFVKRLQDDLNLLVLVKLHPKDKKEYYSELNRQKTIVLDNSELNNNHLSLVDLLVQTRCTITAVSTAALESLLAETPVITIDINKEFQAVDFIQDGLTCHVHDYEELKQTCEALLQSDQNRISLEQKTKIENYYYHYFEDNYEPSKVIAKKIEEVCAV